ncbi:phospholipase A [Pseudomarimonas salicorniae]|uniref:Phospholipase A1 n=1 Tax=Pseudomarimonas salicorniae TaxID=2933270 RepID=A0ABT0GJR8_9GAMM|nr:phospholipase A [Lysobacter sp. CAU 1642]MCK7594768.1 phospholipase A [Lysobacter sp. CAU 1642]
MRSLALPCLLGLLLASTAASQTLEGCRAIGSDPERLACYDQIAERHLRERAAGGRVEDLYRSEPDLAAAPDSMLDRRWELDPESKLGIFNLRAHRPIYILPVFLSNRPNNRPNSPNPANTVDESLDLRSLENKFQVSFKTKVWEGLVGGQGDLWFGYTQSSRWQLYEEDVSRPFRETNYQPEIDLIFGFDEPLLGGWRARMLGIGYAHQSNGRSLPLSRSWDRLVATAAIEKPGWAVVFRPWYRLPESSRDDDNPDANDFLGRAELQVVHQRGAHELAWLVRHSLRGGERSRGALQFDWSFPLYRNLRGHLQLFEGYGESLIDYNHRATYLGIGLSLMPWY